MSDPDSAKSSSTGSKSIRRVQWSVGQSKDTSAAYHDAYKVNKDRIAPELLCHTWLLERSYILCDARSFGFPIQYASAGFADLFECSPLDCQQKKCGALVGIERIQTSDPALKSCIQASGLTAEEVIQAFTGLQELSRREVNRMLSVGTGTYVTLNRTFSGKLLVVAVLMQLLKHPGSGRPYALGLQCEFTDTFSIQDLLSAALRQEEAAAEQIRAFFQQCLDLLKRSDVLEYLHHTMEEIWVAEAAETCRLVGYWAESEAGRDLSQSASSTANHAGSQSSEQESYMQKLAAEGYTVDSVIERSRSSVGVKVLSVQKAGESFAVKCIDDAKIKQKESRVHLTQHLCKEFAILRKLTHPSIVQVESIFHAGNGVAMVMEFVSGQALSQNMSKWTGHELHELASKTLGAVAYLHNCHGIAHGDLRAQNIMISRQGVQPQAGDLVSVKLIGFGHAYEEREPSLAADTFSSLSKTPRAFKRNSSKQIMPPVKVENSGDAFELDVFAMGLVIVGLMVRHEVFTSDVFPGPSFQFTLPQMSQSASDYLGAVLNPNSALRPKIEVANRDLPQLESLFPTSAEHVSRLPGLMLWPTIVMTSCTLVLAGALMLIRTKNRSQG